MLECCTILRYSATFFPRLSFFPRSQLTKNEELTFTKKNFQRIHSIDFFLNVFLGLYLLLYSNTLQLTVVIIFMFQCIHADYISFCKYFCSSLSTFNALFTLLWSWFASVCADKFSCHDSLSRITSVLINHSIA